MADADVDLPSYKFHFDDLEMSKEDVFEFVSITILVDNLTCSMHFGVFFNFLSFHVPCFVPLHPYFFTSFLHSMYVDCNELINKCLIQQG